MLFRSSLRGRDYLIIWVSMSFDPSVRPFTMKLKQEIWSLVILIEVDETYTMVWLSRSPKVKVKVTRPLKLQKWCFSNSISSAISQAILNLIVAYESMGQYLNLVGTDFRISLSFSRHVTSKFAKTALPSGGYIFSRRDDRHSRTGVIFYWWVP